ncbi:aflatoxin regulatory protein-domain-containing protein [Delphinella strobiligena]|nr:aflatoxin regulatory protein-domain-containing protein [Delphinella strobiligena]
MLPSPEDDRSHNQFNHQSNHQHSPASPRQCSHDCTAQALGHLRQLFPSDSACEDGVEKNRGETTISSVIARNKRSIETISKLLQCFCTEDGYLLLIISMILSKALDRYTAAIRGTASPSSDCQFSNPLSHQSSILRGAFSSDGNDERAEESRVATQLILGELQRVQGLIGLVSQRSDTCGPVNSTAGNSNGNSQGKEVRGNLEGHGVAIFSGVLHQVQDDLRRRVRSLSTEIIDLLRRE